MSAANCAVCGGTGWYMRELPGKRHPNQCTACSGIPSSVVLAVDPSWSIPAPAVAVPSSPCLLAGHRQ